MISVFRWAFQLKSEIGHNSIFAVCNFHYNGSCPTFPSGMWILTLQSQKQKRKQNRHTHKLFYGFWSYYFKWSGSEVGLKWNIPLASGTDGHFWMRFCPLVVERDVHFDSLACLHYHPSVKMALILTTTTTKKTCGLPDSRSPRCLAYVYITKGIFQNLKKKKQEEFSLGCFPLENSSWVGHYRQFCS